MASQVQLRDEALASVMNEELVAGKTGDQHWMILPAVEASFAAIAITDLAANLTYVNTAFLRLWGYEDRQEVVGRPSLELWQRRGKARAALEAVEARGSWVGELVARRRDGSVFVVQTSANLVRDENGQPLCMTASFVGGTDWERSEAALRESEQRFRDVLDASADVIYMLNVGSGTYECVSQAAAHLFGFTPHEVTAMGFAGFEKRFHPEDRRRLEVHLDNLLNHTLEEDIQPKIYYRWRCKDNHYRWFSDHRVAIREDSRPLVLVGTIREVTQRKETEERLQVSFERIRETLEKTVNAFAAIVEKRDPYTAGHQQRVARLACAIAREMGLSKEQIEGVRLAAMLHDIGKIHVPAEILSRPGQLTEPEMALVRQHPQIGCEILQGIPFAQPVAQIVLQHHERMDGSGYPSGLPGESILLEARVLAVADVVEAMSAHRPFRPSRGLRKALDEISQGQGRRYDARVAETCLKLLSRQGMAVLEVNGDASNLVQEESHS